MLTLSVKEASDKLPDLVANTIAEHEPILISGKNKNAILMAESDWQRINETLHILSVPAMRDAIKMACQKALKAHQKS